MLLVNTDYIEGKTLEMLGMVSGSTIQSKNIGKDFGAGLKSLVGGELKGYTEMMEEARSVAEQRMVDQAMRLKADAVVNVRYTTSAIMAGASEVMVYGTAVRFK
ncbi:MAG: YbjQ family protein [Lachnospiraceae bacterium]|nr:YbjQ family protein [Lachnospiraceae bacterium]